MAGRRPFETNAPQMANNRSTSHAIAGISLEHEMDAI